MSFTMREKHHVLQGFVLWVLISVFAAVVGPFGTFGELGLGARLLYWGLICGLSVCLTRGVMWLGRGRRQLFRLGLQLPYGVFLACVVHGINLMVFPNWGGWQDFWFLAAVIGAVIALVEVAAFLWLGVLHPVRDEGDAKTDVMENGATGFLTRLPFDKRGALIRLEAQDHYLLVVTARGEETLLMRMGDAEAELSAAAGLRVHRSHWVSMAQVGRHRRENGRDFLEMADGAEVPVSRSYRPAAQEVGLI